MTSESTETMISLVDSRTARLIERRLPMLARLRRTVSRPLGVPRDLARVLVAVVGRAVVDADDRELVVRVVGGEEALQRLLIAAPSLNIGMTTVTVGSKSSTVSSQSVAADHAEHDAGDVAVDEDDVASACTITQRITDGMIAWALT